MWVRLYGWFAFMGLMVVSASMLMGFRYQPAGALMGVQHTAGAPAVNYLINFVLYAAYMAVHWAMLQPWFKERLSGRAEGSTRERQVYVAVAVVTWAALYAAHRPLPGPGLELPAWIGFLGICGFLLSFHAFLEGATFESLGGLLGIPGAQQSHTASAATSLMTEGSYASVRHPMSRGFLFICVSSVAIHPNAAQLAWAIAIGASFVGFIPIEESQLLSARGAAYRRYMKATPYRLLKGVW